MAINFSKIDQLPPPSLAQLGNTPEYFLKTLTAPTIIDIPSKQQQQWRVITTLLHGNEPSGFIALHQLLTEYNQQTWQPYTNIRFIICSVEAAQLSPYFSHRYLPNGEDINRCFAGNNNTCYQQRANLIKQAIDEVQPQAILDLHNTSGSGPAFGVSTSSSHEALALTALFCDTLIISHIHIGALMESRFTGPIITVECGGANDIHAHKTAYQGIKKFMLAKSPFMHANQNNINVIYKPLRLRLKQGIPLTYAKNSLPNNGVILKANIEKQNYGITPQGTILGWVNEKITDCFLLTDENNHNVFEHYFKVENNQLITTNAIKIFMATTNSDIAINDCLFYVAKAQAL